MKDPANQRYFNFLKRLFLLFLPILGALFLIVWLLDSSYDWSRLAGMAALLSAVIASISTYRKST